MGQQTMAIRYRICAEHLDVKEAQKPEVVRLCARAGVAPLLAAHDTGPEADRAVAQAIELYVNAGLPGAGVWPLLRKDQGYWPSERDPELFVERVERYLQHATSQPPCLLIDLEPPLHEMQNIGSLRAAAGCMWRSFSPRRFSHASHAFSVLAEHLRRNNIESVACTVPLVAGDFWSGGAFWQDTWESPISTVDWDVICPMTYTTLIEHYGRGHLDQEAARRFGFLAARATVRRFGERASAFVGLVGTGVLKNEPVYSEPDELARDAAAMRAAGAKDIIAFCLEGVLAKSEPERWLAALTGNDRVVPQSRAGDLLWASVAAAGALGVAYRFLR